MKNENLIFTNPTLLEKKRSHNPPKPYYHNKLIRFDIRRGTFSTKVKKLIRFVVWMLGGNFDFSCEFLRKYLPSYVSILQVCISRKR